MTKASRNDTSAASRYGSKKCEMSGSPIAPRRIERRVIPICTRRDEADRLVHQPERDRGDRLRPSRAISWSRAAPRRHERVLRERRSTAFPSTSRMTMRDPESVAHARPVSARLRRLGY